MTIDPSDVQRMEFGVAEVAGISEARRTSAQALLTEFDTRLEGDLPIGRVRVTDIFYALALSNFLGRQPSHKAELVPYLRSLKAGHGFRSEANPTPKSNVLRGALEKPCLYATYAVICSLALLGESADEYLEDAAVLIDDFAKPSGWIYNDEIGDTAEERKFHDELSREALSASRLLRLGSRELTDEKRKKLVGAAEQLADTTPYMSVLAHLAEVITQLGGQVPDRAGPFLQTHFDPATGGFFEYIFEEAKLDEVAGQVQRYAHDYLVPSVIATYRGLQIMSLGEIDFSGDKAVFVDGSSRFFDELEPLAAGFGTAVKIARFEEALGPVATLQETILALIGPAMISQVRS